MSPGQQHELEIPAVADKNGAGFLEFLREFPGAIRASGIDSPSGGQARPLGESIGTGKAGTYGLTWRAAALQTSRSSWYRNSRVGRAPVACGARTAPSSRRDIIRKEMTGTRALLHGLQCKF